MRPRPQRGMVPPCQKELAALCHCRAGPADRGGPVEILDRVLEWVRSDRSRLSEGIPARAGRQIRLGEDRIRFPHLPPELAQCIEWKRLSDAARQSAQDLPVFAR